MSSELTIVALFGLLIVVTIFVHVTLALPQVGLPYLLSPRDERKPLTGVAARLERAVINCTIGFALFSAAVLVLGAQSALGGQALLAAQIVLWARVIYVIVYGAGWPWIRTLAWAVSILATAWLFLMAL
jgi:uncharacterized MAPEG superfamily protein